MDPSPRGQVVEVQGVSVVLGGRRVLSQVSFGIAPGQFTGLIGTNGAGKTTLLRVILGLQRPSEGQVLVEGRSGHGRDLIGYVPQKVVLDADLPMRARDLVALGIDGHRFGFPVRRTGRDAVDAMIAAVGAEGFATERVGTLSGGELQRVLIAHALVSRPRLLVLDEPLANLDLLASHEIVALLHSIAVEHDVAVLLSAHELNPLLPVMDRVVYLADGRAASGTTDEVVRSEVLSGLYGHHVDVIRVHGRVLVVVGSPDEGDVPTHGSIEVT